jgi:hypothetical protein
MHSLLAALVLSASPAGECQPSPTQSASTASEVVSRGDTLKGLPTVALAEVLAHPSSFEGKTVAVEAKVRRACQKKGCWMELAASDEGPGVRVTFKDYGFFVPTDSAGRIARVEGTVKVATLSEAHAKHLEGEGARVARSSTGVAQEVELVASGVELKK